LDRRDAFIILSIALAAWSAASVGVRNSETAPIQQLVEDVPTYEDRDDSYRAPIDRSTIVVVCDVHGQPMTRWMASEGAALIAKGWRIQTIDLEGSTEFRFYVYQGGTWKIHNGHLSLQTLTTLLSRTTPPQPRSMQTGSPSVAEGLSK
jgi:hypothetical protein